MFKAFSNRLFDSSFPYAFLGVILGSAFIGASPIFVRLSAVDPFATGFFRFFFALPFLWTWMVIDTMATKESRHPKMGKDYLLLSVAGVFFALDIAFWHHSLHHTSVVNSTLLNSMTPIFVTLIAWFVWREKISGISVIGVIFAIAGTCLLVLAEGKIGEVKFFGDFLALISALFFAGYVLIVKHLRGYFTAPTIMAWSSMSCMYCLAILTFSCEQHIIPSHWEEWLPLLGLAVIVHAMGQGLIAVSLKHLSATFSAITMMITPVVSALLAWVLFQEPFTGLKIAGGLIIVVGIIIARQNEK